MSEEKEMIVWKQMFSGEFVLREEAEVKVKSLESRLAKAEKNLEVYRETIAKLMMELDGIKK